MKRCPTCGVEKEWSEFGRHKGRPDGHASQCRKCRADAAVCARYGIDQGLYDWLRRVQDDRCAICGNPETASGRRLAMDHDHEDGLHRGLLCLRCNQMLGLVGEDPEVLQQAIEYLRFWNETVPAVAGVEPKAHKKRAKALGHPEMIPEGW